MFVSTPPGLKAPPWQFGEFSPHCGLSPPGTSRDASLYRNSGEMTSGLRPGAGYWGHRKVDVAFDTDGIARLVPTRTPDGAGWAMLQGAASASLADSLYCSTEAERFASAVYAAGLASPGCASPQPDTEAASQAAAPDALRGATPAALTAATTVGARAGAGGPNRPARRTAAGGNGGAARGTGVLHQPQRHVVETVITHPAPDGMSLSRRIQAAVGTQESSSDTLPVNSVNTTNGKNGQAAGARRIVVELLEDCTETEAVDITSGDVLIRPSPAGNGSDSQEVEASADAVAAGGSRVQIRLPAFRVSGGGSLSLQNIAVCATEENRVQAGRLSCDGCFVTSRGGCGVLCLQQAKASLVRSCVTRCLRSGIGVNGKGTEISLRGCVVSENGFSGLGVNHAARTIALHDNKFLDNRWAGIWLNRNVVAHWHGGEMAGNKAGSKDGLGTLVGFEA
eukprot:TRINITY_DN21150_c0_g1_i1.p1 TRINITY_DN21150_c0_g1~~TRINITY_DN21150_c0_g1_i1.p1  ORF type:complete len:463 (-),score=71.06 TRINITY_DN21150_c0_g1_i1:392-1747(-)